MNVDVTITSPSPTKSKADVGSAVVSKGDTVTWINNTNDVMIVFIPWDKLANSQNHFFRSIDPGGGSDTIKITTSKKSKYRYAVFCLDTNSLATGSDLEIIVQ